MDTFITVLKEGIENRLINNQTLTLQISTILNPRFKLLLIEEDDQATVRGAVLRGLRDNSAPTPGTGDAATEDAHGPEPTANPLYKPHKGSLLTTLTDIVSERIGSSSGAVERQPGTLTTGQ